MQFRRVLGVMMVCVCAPLLLVGITQPLVHFEIEVNVIGQTIKVLTRERSLLGGDDPEVKVKKGEKPTKKGLINTLWQDEAYSAAVLLFLFGVCIPVTKLLVFAAWITDVFGPEVSEMFLRHGRLISKWAAVDAVCEALLVGILMKAGAVYAYHKIGFPCFVAYCIISSLAFSFLPQGMEAEDPKPNLLHTAFARRMTSTRRRVYVLVSSLTIFLVLLGFAGSLHMCRVWIPKSEMIKAIDEYIAGNPAFAILGNSAIRKQLEERIGSVDLVDVNASLAGSIGRLLMSGHFSTVMGSFFLMYCTILLPVTYAVLSVCKAITVSDLSPEEKESLVEGNSDTQIAWWPELERVRVFAHDLSMLDVMTVGTIIGQMAIKGEPFLDYQDLMGQTILIMAAVHWHFHSFLCRACQIGEHAGVEEPGAEPEGQAIQG